MVATACFKSEKPAWEHHPLVNPPAGHSIADVLFKPSLGLVFQIHCSGLGYLLHQDLKCFGFVHG